MNGPAVEAAREMGYNRERSPRNQRLPEAGDDIETTAVEALPMAQLEGVAGPER